jgi:hypothetical protein
MNVKPHKTSKISLRSNIICFSSTHSLSLPPSSSSPSSYNANTSISNVGANIDQLLIECFPFLHSFSLLFGAEKEEMDKVCAIISHGIHLFLLTLHDNRLFTSHSLSLPCPEFSSSTILSLCAVTVRYTRRII